MIASAQRLCTPLRGGGLDDAEDFSLLEEDWREDFHAMEPSTTAGSSEEEKEESARWLQTQFFSGSGGRGVPVGDPEIA